MHLQASKLVVYVVLRELTSESLSPLQDLKQILLVIGPCQEKANQDFMIRYDGKESLSI